MMDSLSLRHRPKKFAPCAALVPVGALAAVTVFAGARFVVLDVAHPPGLDFVHRNSPTSQKYLIETMGGGVALLDYNNGDGTFTDVTARAGVEGSGWSASAGFFDYDNDGKLDLFVTRYLDWDIGHNILCGVHYAVYCRPDKFGPVSSVLYHNNSD